MQSTLKNPSRSRPLAAKLERRAFLKQLGFGAAGLGLVASFPPCLSVEAGVFGDADRLPRSHPEAQGVSSAGILAFLEAIENSKHEFHSFMLVRHGHVVAEGWWSPYRVRANHMLYSLSKSFTSTALGFAVCEGKLEVEDPLTSFFPEDLPAEISANLAALRVKHLLTMSVGHAQDSTGTITKEQNWVKSFLSLPIANPPGSVFLYNSGATYMLSAIVQKLSGQRVIDYLRPRLFEPLDITGMTWETCPRGINTGGWGLSLPTEGLAKFGELYLQKGVWKGRRILPAIWIEEATTFKIQQPAAPGADLAHLKETSDWMQGYCYQFWRCRHHAFRGDGAFGQFMVVMPEQDAIVAITCETSDMQGELNLVWDHLLPAMNEAPLRSDGRTDSLLRKKLSALTLPPPAGLPAPSTAQRVSGQTFALESNSLGARRLTFDFRRDGCVFKLIDSTGEHLIQCGAENWVDGETDMPGTPPKLTVGDLRPAKIAASGAWRDQDTYQMTWRFYETPHHTTAACHFDGESVHLELANSVNHNKTVLTGRTQGT
jgi:CubicO group peptidase (beta-lactamase class C family)